MQVLKKIIYSIITKPSLYLFVFLIFFSFDRANRWFDHDRGNFPFIEDVDQYYSYLSAAFIHDDLSFKFTHGYWTTHMENGNEIPKVTYGMAVMYSPFFFAGDMIASCYGYKRDGYSLPYKWAIHIGSIFFSLLGLWFVRRALLFYFNEYVTFISLIAVFFATNLFYYTYGLGEMSHVYLFFLFSVFIVNVLKWLRTSKIKHLYLFAFIAGFVTLIRPTDCLILFFPVLAEIRSVSELKERFRFIFSYRFHLFFAGIVFILPFFVQMLYWKMYAGSWFFFSYGSEERFFFNDPQIFNFLFSFRKGWFIYTPIMLFSVIGIYFMRKKVPGLLWFTILFLVLNVYILSSWWDWAFGGSFGCRAMIQHYAFLVFPLAAFVAFVSDAFKTRRILAKVTVLSLIVLFYFLILLNQHQSWQFKYGIIHYNGMTRDAYFYVLNKDNFTPEEAKALNGMIKQPNVEAMRRGDRDL